MAYFIGPLAERFKEKLNFSDEIQSNLNDTSTRRVLRTRCLWFRYKKECDETISADSLISANAIHTFYLAQNMTFNTQPIDPFFSYFANAESLHSIATMPLSSFFIFLLLQNVCTNLNKSRNHFSFSFGLLYWETIRPFHNVFVHFIHWFGCDFVFMPMPIHFSPVFTFQ